MQDFQSIPGLAGRLFGGAADIRRAGAHQLQQGAAAAASRCGGGGGFSQEVVKCPRCESTNTKFCYYNNYNLSQPRHFCKSCRRYWTKGGVLRNVPVGGGCRKSKRGSSSSATPTSPTATATDNSNAKSQRRASSSSRDSNSGSNSPTATAPPPPSTPSSVAFANPFAGDVPPPAPIFADQAAALASLFAPPAPPPLPVFSFSPQPAAKTEGSAAVGSVPPVAAVLLAAEPEAPGASEPADMAPFMSLDTGIFELGDDASVASYWNAGSCCWGTDGQDPSVYLP